MRNGREVGHDPRGAGGADGWGTRVLRTLKGVGLMAPRQGTCEAENRGGFGRVTISPAPPRSQHHAGSLPDYYYYFFP